MSFRRRMILLAAGAVATAIVLASVVVYFVTRGELLGQIDTSLRATLTPGLPEAVRLQSRLSAAEVAALTKGTKQPNSGLVQPDGALAVPVAVAGSSQSRATGEVRGVAGGAVQRRSDHSANGEVITIERRTVVRPKGSVARNQARGLGAGQDKLVLPQPKLGGTAVYVQLSEANGTVLTAGRGPQLPVTAAARAVASGKRDAFFSDAIVAGTPARVLTERAPHGAVWDAAEPLGGVEGTLTHLKLVLAIVCLGGIALAAVLGLLVSRVALVPVRRLTGAAERVARTQDLAHRIEAPEEDELGRLARTFNMMLAALERSRLAQRQLVSDASHELRTPLTSVQANLDALILGERLPASERARVLAAAKAQLQELSVLVGDLVDLSKTEIEDGEVEDVRLDLAVAGALGRARLHAPGCRFVLDAQPCLVRGAPGRLDRAIANLLDNACKWNPPGAGPIELRVRDGRLEVRDHGPGISRDDLPRVFDRFYRSPEARGRPGSGLGLAIVRQTAEAHGGFVHAANDPDGGALLTLELPPLEMTETELAAANQDGPAAFTSA